MRTYTGVPVTVAALDGTPDDGSRYEVIEGELYVSTAPGYPHQFALVSRKRKEGGLEIAAVLHDGEDLTSPVLPEFRVPVSQIFA